MAAIVRPEKTKVPELLTAQATLDMVIVPPEGEKFPEAPIVKVPTIEKEAEVVTVAEAAMLMF